ncbi:Uncharacterised protein [Legionella pneumophila]|nr:Uncharacterised protein [Legionella pneumophila]
MAVPANALVASAAQDARTGDVVNKVASGLRTKANSESFHVGSSSLKYITSKSSVSIQPMDVSTCSQYIRGYLYQCT